MVTLRAACLSSPRPAAAGRAVAEGPAHAYLLHGPAGRRQARARPGAFAGRPARRRAPRSGGHASGPLPARGLGDMIRIDEVRALHRDLHMRPYEADSARLRDLGRAPPERGRGRRAAEGSRGAAAVRRDRARRRRARPAAADDPLPLPARLLPPRSGAGDARPARRARAGAVRGGGEGARARVRRHGSTAPSGCSTRRRARRREELLRSRVPPYAEPELDPADAARDGARRRARGTASPRRSAPRRSSTAIELTDARGGAAPAPRAARRRAGGAARLARGARVVVPRPRRRRCRAPSRRSSTPTGST